MEDDSLQLSATRDGERRRNNFSFASCVSSSYTCFLFLSLQSEVEEDILKTMQRLQDSVNNLDQTGNCQVDPKCTSSFKELVQVRGGQDFFKLLVDFLSCVKFYN